MLNKTSLETILNISLPDIVVEDIHWKIQESTPTSLVFYKIGYQPNAQALFEERAQKSSFSWVILNKDISNPPPNSSVINERDWPEIQKRLMDELYPLPDLKLIAITGTNGKTTTTDLVLQLGHLIGKKGLSIGTLGVREWNKNLADFGLTSPSYIDLRKFLNRFGKDKDFCVLEASSHALDQQRLFGLKFDGAGWLSFSQDHLDYHKTMDEYFEAKLKVFNHLKSDAKLFLPKEQVALFEKIYQRKDGCYQAREIKDHLPLFFQAQFNRNNLEVAASIISDVFQTQVKNVWDKLTPPDGRFYVKEYKSNYVVVDFAHTPDALENICKGILQAFPEHKLKVLFGCGGDRDKTKRPQMGKVADQWAQKIYLTSDNPRSEDPEKIIQDIKAGISRTEFICITDRKQAVRQAMDGLMEQEVLLLAGKGHEDYILINGVKHPYSDIAEIENYILGK